MGKKRKEALMHVAVCTLLSTEGYYKFTWYYNEGWPQYEKVQGLPKLNLKEQEDLLKVKVVEYFEAL